MKIGTDINGPCRFMDGQGRASVGLVSYPGSGNTWLRAVLEAATGICTGEYKCRWEYLMMFLKSPL